MKPNNNSESGISLTGEVTEIAINARLLYVYVGQPELSYESWAASLRGAVASPRHVSRFRLLTGADGELALNVDFAAHWAERVSSDLMGIIALILIDEGCRAVGQGDADDTNRALKRFQALALARGQMHAETLHAFLQVKQPYRQWFVRLKKEHRMLYGTDYRRLTFNKNNEPKVHPKDTGKGHVIFGPKFALKIAAAEPTPRGRVVQTCLGPVAGANWEG